MRHFTGAHSKTSRIQLCQLSSYPRSICRQTWHSTALCLFLNTKKPKKDAKRTSRRYRRNGNLFRNKTKIVRPTKISLDKVYKEIVMLKNEFKKKTKKGFYFHTLIDSPSYT